MLALLLETLGIYGLGTTTLPLTFDTLDLYNFTSSYLAWETREEFIIISDFYFIILEFYSVSLTFFLRNYSISAKNFYFSCEFNSMVVRFNFLFGYILKTLIWELSSIAVWLTFNYLTLSYNLATFAID